MLPLVVDDTLLNSIAQVESAGNPSAVSSAGAKGLYQLMDATGREWHVKLKITESYDPFNPEQSRTIARAFLESLYGIFKVPELAVGAYNCGPGRLYRAMKAAQSTKWELIQDHCPRETKEYVKRVSNEYDRRRARSDREGGGAVERFIERLRSEKDIIQPRPNISVGLAGQNMEDGMVEWLKKLVAGSVAKSIIRKLMVLLSGVLLGIGIDPTVVSQFTSAGTEVIIAVFLYLIAQVWSIVEKKAVAAGKA